MLEEYISNNAYSRKILNFIKSNNIYSKSEMLRNYRLAVMRRLIAAISDIYPALYKLLGPKEFKRIVYLYIQNHFVHNEKNILLGKNLSEFIHLGEDTKIKYAADLAKLEWLGYECYLAPKEFSLRKNMLDNLTEYDLSLKLMSSVRILHSYYPIHEILDWITSCPQEDIFFGRERFQMQEVHLLLVRINEDIKIITITPLEFNLLVMINQNIPLDMIFIILLERFNVDEDQITVIIEKLLSLGVFIQK